jgi:hypothetical protein
VKGRRGKSMSIVRAGKKSKSMYTALGEPSTGRRCIEVMCCAMPIAGGTWRWRWMRVVIAPSLPHLDSPTHSPALSPSLLPPLTTDPSGRHQPRSPSCCSARCRAACQSRSRPRSVGPAPQPSAPAAPAASAGSRLFGS